MNLIVIIVYLVIVFGLAVGFSRPSEVDGFLINNRKTSFAFLLFSIVSTNVGAGFFLTVASEAYVSGISFAVSMILVSAVTSMVFAILCGRIKSISDSIKIRTIPELLSKRYNSRVVGVLASIVFIGGYLFVTALQFVGIGAVGSVISGISLDKIILVSGILTIVYTSVAGFRGDLIADAISFIVMAIVFFSLVPIALFEERVDFSKLGDTYWNPLQFGGYGFLILSFLLAMVSAFMFMEIWQRIFAAKSVRSVRKAFWVSVIVQPAFICCACFFGLVGAVVFEGGQTSKQTVLFDVLNELLPGGFSGLGIVAVLSVLMSTVNSLILVGGSTLYVDIINPQKEWAQKGQGLLSVRICTILFGSAALVLAYIFPRLVELLLMGAFVMMPLVPSVIGALLNRRPTALWASLSIVIGILVTFLFLPSMPQTAFGPGFLASLLVILVPGVIAGRETHSINE